MMRNLELFASWLAAALAQLFPELESMIAPTGALPKLAVIVTCPEVASATAIGAPRRLPVTELPAVSESCTVPVPIPQAKAAAARMHAATKRIVINLLGEAGASPAASDSHGRPDPQ